MSTSFLFDNSRVHYISPYRADKNIGKAINDAVSAIDYNNYDFIVHLDHDCMFLLPDTKAQVERILQSTPYDVLSCMTNRIRSKEQLVGGYFNPDDHIRNHIEIAEQVRLSAGDLVIDAKGVMAAFMLCFRVSAWEKVGGFVEGPVNFDTVFCGTVRAVGLRIGLMRGVYVFHAYRIMSKIPLQDVTHLINKI